MCKLLLAPIMTYTVGRMQVEEFAHPIRWVNQGDYEAISRLSRFSFVFFSRWMRRLHT